MGFTYPEVGATRTGTLPTGYRWVRVATRIGSAAVLPEAVEAVLTWRLHHAAGMRISADAPVAAPGVAVTVRIGIADLRLAAPCRVVWSTDEPHRAGFGYGTLPGHPVRGEESFVVERIGGQVWFRVDAFSRPAARPARWAWPVLGWFQRGYADHLGATLRRLLREP